MIKRCYLKGIPVDAGLREDIWGRVTDWLSAGEKSRQIVTLNAVMLMSALNDCRFRSLLQATDLVTSDGSGIVLALKKNGISTQRYPGVELADQLLHFCVQVRLPVYIYGGTVKTAFLLRQKMSADPLVLIKPGFGEKEDTVREEIVKTNPKLLLVGLGSPRQEFFLAKLLPELKETVGIGVGGALEVITNQRSRAPEVFINHGCEWCYRMIQNPGKIRLIPQLIKFWYHFVK